MALSKEKKPLTIGAYAQEKQGASEQLKFLAAVFKGAKADITSALQDELVPSKKEAVEETEKSDAEKAADAYDDARVKAMTELDKCISDGTAESAANARKAMRGLNSTSRAVDETQPFDSDAIDSIKITDSVTNIKTACTTAKSKIT